MQKGFLGSALINEERRAAKLFLVLFYSINLGYDFIYYYLFPLFIKNDKLGFAYYNVPLSLVMYSVQVLILVSAIVLLKRNKPQSVKYVLFYAYTITNVIIDSTFYLVDTQVDYRSGNIIEMFIVLLSPIFISRRFFWTVTLGTLSKYLIIGLIIRNADVLLPAFIVAGISVIASILLGRIQGYVTAIQESYTNQLEGIVKGIIATLELKDPYTRGHSERVAQYSLMFARRYGGFTEEELKGFHYACLLHDVGKVNIPDYILMKPSNLTNEEYEIIKTHPAVGANAVRDIEGLQDSIDVILYHHERWDGKGYPAQLKGPDIPLKARITAIADAFDAMTTQRSYRPALPLDIAFQRIVQGKGTQFDPDLVDAFVHIYPLWASYYDSSWKDTTLPDESIKLRTKEVN